MKSKRTITIPPTEWYIWRKYCSFPHSDALSTIFRHPFDYIQGFEFLTNQAGIFNLINYVSNKF
jgi:hypothetical protein